MNDLIVVKQLPVIEERLQTISAEVTAKVEQALSLAVTEDTVKVVKTHRAELRKDFEALETERKAVKSAILAPYEAFEAVYKKYITEVFSPADAKLKTRIDEVETALKNEKAEAVEAYYSEYAQSLGIDFVPFERAGIPVRLSDSEKSLKTAAKTFLDKVNADLLLIDTQEFKDEIMVEYKNTLNASQAVVAVTERKKAIAEEQERKEAEAARLAEQETVTEKVEAVLAPPKEVEPEKVYTLRFTVQDTKPRLIALKEFLDKGEYRYEQGN